MPVFSFRIFQTVQVYNISNSSHLLQAQGLNLNQVFIFPAIMGSGIEPSLLESLTQKFVSLQTKGGLEHVVSNKLDREALLASLRQLTQALETPSDIVNRVVFFVGDPNQCY
jgi:hypothetical protein